MAKGYHKLLSYKDEYEVARLLSETHSKASETFDGDIKLTYHLAPPILSRLGADGRPKKREFGGMAQMFLACAFQPAENPFDPFGYTAERKMERSLIRIRVRYAWSVEERCRC